MKKSVFVIASLLFLPAVVFALDLPEPKGFVNDYVGILSPEAISGFEARLTVFNVETSNEITVAIVPDLQDTTVEDFSEKLFQKWGVGKEGRDNGILFLVSINDRKARFEIGYGLEGAVTDGTAGQILDREVLPFFKKGDYDKGIGAGLHSLINATKGEYQPLPTPKKGSGFEALVAFIFNGGFFLVMVFLSYLASFLGRSKRIWPGAALGFVGGGAFGFFIGTFVTAIGVGIFISLLGLMFDFIVSRNYQERKRLGLPTDFRHSRGGFWLGGGRGFGGGGFGGFGGGGSGGGGASRGW